jgi:hypothetical protein
MFHSDFMNETIRWPEGDFTIEELIGLNPSLAPLAVRKKLSAAVKAKAAVQTKKGNEKVKGKFKVAKTT